MAYFANKKSVVLCVDDEPQIQRLIGRMLRGESVTLLFAGSAQDTATQLESSDVDGVLLDLCLGSAAENGISILRSIRGGDRSTLPVCVVSADCTAESLFQSLLFQADGFLCKTDDPEVFKHGLTTFVRSVQNADQSAHRFCPDDQYLRSRGLTERQIALLLQYSHIGFAESAAVLGGEYNASETAINKMFSRIQKTLGISRKAELHRLLTVLSGFRLRQTMCDLDKT